MSKGRGSGSKAMIMVVAIALLCLLFNSVHVHAKTYTVGDGLGWTFGSVFWATGKTFKAGDVLVFKYFSRFHNVVEVDKKGYDSCKAPEGSKVHNTGNDTITLKKGTNSFICTFLGHCLLGMKISVNAD